MTKIKVPVGAPSSVAPKMPGAQCAVCPLADRQLVPGVGPPGRVELMLIGEGPGREEALQGRPFVGRSGKLLDAVLKRTGIDRANVWIDNAHSCGPPPQSDPVITRAVKCCNNRLQLVIKAKKPKVILTLGAHAMHAVGVGGGVLKKRGTVNVDPVVPEGFDYVEEDNASG